MAATVEAFVEGDAVRILSEDGFDAMEGIIIEIEQPEAREFIGGCEEWEIDQETLYLVVFQDESRSWFEAGEMEHV